MANGRKGLKKGGREREVDGLRKKKLAYGEVEEGEEGKRGGGDEEKGKEE